MTVTRRKTIAWLARIAAALALAGCGAGAAAQTNSQVPSFPDLGYQYIPPQIPAGTPHGAVLAVDLTNVGRVRPQAMRLASDTVLSGASWTGWGSPTANAHGNVTVRVCSPSCGGGHDARYRATVSFSHLKACRSYRFYESASVTLDTVAGPRRWGAFLKDPCSS